MQGGTLNFFQEGRKNLMAYKITFTEDVTLVVLDEAPADLCFVASAFEALADNKINIDMISQSPPKGVCSRLAFTLSDNDLGKALETIAKLREVFPGIKISVSSGNTKLLISGDEMKNNYGVAAKAFKAVAATHADVRMITTSEIDISLLVTGLDLELIESSLNAALNS